MSELQTAFWMEEVDDLRLGFSYMAAVKLLKENGVPIDRLPPFYYDFYTLEVSFELLRAYFEVTDESPFPSRADFTDHPDELPPEDDEELAIGWIRVGDVEREKLLDMVAITLGESLYDAEYKAPWLRLVFFPGYLPEPMPLEVAEFVVAFHKEWGLCRAA
ncbi:hypothetical protein V3F56_03440 [Moorellaceae bacterium AZ2]